MLFLRDLEDGQPDIVQDNWSDPRMSEKSRDSYATSLYRMGASKSIIGEGKVPVELVRY